MKTFRTLLVAAGVACATLSVSAAHAATIDGLFNTGVDAGGAPLAENALDSHYLVNGTGTPVVYDHPTYIVVPDGRFIAQEAGGSLTTNPSTYSLTFDLGALSAATAQLSGFFAADNFASAFLNGHLLAQDNQFTDVANFKSLTPFSAGAADFVSGLNTLSFVVTDTGPPSALLVSGLSGTALEGGVPEPASWALMIGGFGLAGAALRRRRPAAATA